MQADINSYQKTPIEIINSENDLFFKKDIKPITAHQSLKQIKGCIKIYNNNNITNISNIGIKKSNYIINERSNDLNKKLNNYNEEYKKIIQKKYIILKIIKITIIILFNKKKLLIILIIILELLQD